MNTSESEGTKLYKALTDNVKEYVHCRNMVIAYDEHQPPEKPVLDRPTIESAEDLDRYFSEEDRLIEELREWRKNRDDASMRLNNAMCSIRDAIRDSMRGVWLKVHVDGKEWGVRKEWYKGQGNYIEAIPWEEALKTIDEVN